MKQNSQSAIPLHTYMCCQMKSKLYAIFNNLFKRNWKLEVIWNRSRNKHLYTYSMIAMLENIISYKWLMFPFHNISWLQSHMVCCENMPRRCSNIKILWLFSMRYGFIEMIKNALLVFPCRYGRYTGAF